MKAEKQTRVPILQLIAKWGPLKLLIQLYIFCVYLQSSILTVLAVALVIIAELPIRLRRLAFLPLIRWLPPARLCLTLPAEVILILLLKPLCVFCFGI